MTRRTLGILWGAIVAATGLASAATMNALGPTESADWSVPPVEVGASERAGSTAAVASRIADANPFRLDRRPSALPFGSSAEVAGAIPSLERRPPSVSGVLGPPWRAVLEGVPNREGGVLVARGDTLAGWRIRSVTADTIVIQGRDTTWVLPVRRP